MRTALIVPILAAVAAAIFGPGCGPRAAPPPPRPAYTYRVGPGDVLAITITREPELTRERVVVAPDGTLGIPGLGTVQVQGRTLEEVHQLALSLVRKEINALVGVTLLEMHSSLVHVLGEVGIQAPIPFRDGMSAVQAISAAGGPVWAWAKIEDVRIVRGALTSPQYIPVDLEEVFDGEEKDVYLQPGDIVVVPAKWITRWDRYVTQLMAPLRLGATTGTSAASVGTTLGTTSFVGVGGGTVAP